MWNQMGWIAKGVAVCLFIMSMWSFGVAFERIFTFTQARNQSKLFAPQVAKHLKEGRLKEAIALASSKNFRYSHLAKVVLAGLQEYQFQQDSGQNLGREDVMDTVRRAIQRAAALTASDMKKGVSALATIGSTAPFVGLLGTVIGVINAFHVPGYRRQRIGWYRRRVDRNLRGARRDGARVGRRDSRRVVLQLPHRPGRVLQRRDGQLLVGAR
jgi:biopolymer transport protein ExbB/biopolymer transport protein TolQ